MSSLGVTFNSKSAEFIGRKCPTKMRLDASYSKGLGLRLRPTTRKNGINLLVDLVPKGKSGLFMELDNNTLEKMSSQGMPVGFLQAGDRYSLIEDRYGWIVMVQGEDHDSSLGLATVSSIKSRA